MPNTHRGWAVIPLFAGSAYKFDQIASMIAAGSAQGGAYDVSAASPGLDASTTFPRAASLHQAVGASGAPLYVWDTLLFRSSATSMFWLTDPAPSVLANASVGIPMFGSDPKPIVFPAAIENFSAYAVGAGQLAMIFLQGDDLDI